ncbi:MAG: phosphatidate cytidylyltransferase [Pirellulaceae bacterium]
MNTMPLAQLINGAQWLNTRTLWLLGVVLVLLAVAYGVGVILKRQPESNINPALLRTFNLRVRAWWMMYAILLVFFLLGYTMTVVLFGLVSFWALREFITMTPTRRADHRALFWVLIVFTPLQYLLVGLGRSFVDPGPNTWTEWVARGISLRGVDFYGLYSIMIPVYCSLFIPARIAMSGDYKRFLERSAKIQAGLLVCVYSLSHAPALLQLELLTWKPAPAAVAAASAEPDPSPPSEESAAAPSTEPTATPVSDASPSSSPGTGRRPWHEGAQVGLLFYFILIVQTGDVFQYIWGKAFGRRPIAPEISTSRTWEGFFGGVATTTVLGAMLWWVTPFRIWEAALMSLVTAIMGFAGGMTMSAIKRDRGVTDTGTLVQGHAGVLDRIDSICFSAPVFFHLTRFYFSDLS